MLHGSHIATYAVGISRAWNLLAALLAFRLVLCVRGRKINFLIEHGLVKDKIDMLGKLINGHQLDGIADENKGIALLIGWVLHIVGDGYRDTRDSRHGKPPP